MTRYRTPKSTGIALALLSLSASMVLAGCGETDADLANAETGSPAASAAPGDGAELNPPVATPTPEATTVTHSAPAPARVPAPESTTPADPDLPAGESATTADCLPGNWYLDNEGFAAALTLSETPDEDAVTGVLMMTFDEDGTVETLYEDWSMTYSGSGAATLTRNGTDHGTYAIADDGTVSVDDTTIDSTTLLTQSVDGVEETTEEEALSQFSSTTFRCSGDELIPNDFVSAWALHREH